MKKPEQANIEEESIDYLKRSVIKEIKGMTSL